MCARKLGKTRDAVKLMREVGRLTCTVPQCLLTGTGVSMIIVSATFNALLLCLKTTYLVYHTLCQKKWKKFL